MNTALIALARTAIPYAVAWLLSLPAAPPLEAALGVTAADARSELTAAGVAVVGTVYYAGVRWMERRWPASGWLLGVPAPPSYPAIAAAGSEDALDVAASTGARIVEHDG